MKLRTIEALHRELGTIRTIHTLSYRVMKRYIGYRAYVGVITDVDRLRYGEDAGLPEPYRADFLSYDDCLRHVDDPDNDLDREFLAEFRTSGDRCYGVFHGQSLVSYSFYARRPTPINERLTLHFDTKYVYVYKSFTLKEHRGKRLHGLSMAMAVRRMHREDGCLGIIAYVESYNYKSLRSGARMGHREFGVIRLAEIAGRPRVLESPGCRQYGFKITVND